MGEECLSPRLPLSIADASLGQLLSVKEVQYDAANLAYQKQKSLVLWSLCCYQNNMFRNSVIHRVIENIAKMWTQNKIAEASFSAKPLKLATAPVSQHSNQLTSCFVNAKHKSKASILCKRIYKAHKKVKNQNSQHSLHLIKKFMKHRSSNTHECRNKNYYVAILFD